MRLGNQPRIDATAVAAATEPVALATLVKEQLAMPDGYRIPPHFHPSFEHVEVKEGTLLAGMGDRPDPKRTRALTAGDSATAPVCQHSAVSAKASQFHVAGLLGDEHTIAIADGSMNVEMTRGNGPQHFRKIKRRVRRPTTG